MKADPFVQLRLLDLQAVDTTLAQLAHRRRALPEHAVVVAADERLAALADDGVRARTELGDLDREQIRLEGDVDQVRARSSRDRQRMDDGTVTSGKELERLQHEVSTLTRRQGDLEDQVLELMERREAAEAVVAGVQAEVDEVTGTRAAAAVRRDELTETIDVDTGDQQQRREELAASMPADLLALYERVRASGGGTGAAALHQRRCEGCRLEVSGADLMRARSAPSNEVLRCEQCSRILVRTAESGL